MRPGPLPADMRPGRLPAGPLPGLVVAEVGDAAVTAQPCSLLNYIAEGNCSNGLF